MAGFGKTFAGQIIAPLLLFLTLGLSACIRTDRTYLISHQPNHIQKTRAAILVSRMHSAGIVLENISLETDYSLRYPSASGTGNKDIYVGDEDRMKASLAEYPYHYYHSERRFQRYYKNITPEITDAIKQLMSDKGYQPMDLRILSRDWPQPVSEMTVGNILQRIGGQAEVLLVVHYEDFGDMRWKNPFGMSESKGFNELHYVAAFYDTSTRERLFLHSPARYSLHTLLLHDPDIKSDPALQNRIQYFSNEGHRGSSTRMSHNFSDGELIAFALKYARKGFSFMLNSYGSLGSECGKNPKLCQGLEDVIP